MPRLVRVLIALLLSTSFASAQAKKTPRSSPPATPSSAETASTHLPVRKVVLYKNGIGYFEHAGRVRGNEDITVEFTTAQLNDVLNSLTVVDLGNGRVTGVRYNSMAPLEQRVRALHIPVGTTVTRADCLAALRGARVEVRGGASAVGRILSVERSQKLGPNGQTLPTTELTLVTDAGEIRNIELTPATSVRLLDRELGQDVDRYLTLLGTARDNDTRRMTISTAGTGERQLFIGYLSEAPVWKTTYRVLLSSKADNKPLLQGWAVVDNTTGEDWKDVELSLISGAPQSFIQDISSPYYVRRPVVAMPQSFSLSPQTHGATIDEMSLAGGTFSPGTGALHGNVTDPQGAALANARVTLRNEATGESQSTTTDSDGNYLFNNVAQGKWTLYVEYSGFRSFQQRGINVPVGRTSSLDARLTLAAAETTVEVNAAAPLVETSRAEVSNSFSKAARQLQVEATTQNVGDLFEYDLSQKITIGRNQSALVPIVNAPVDAEKVTLWTDKAVTALRALWLKNSSGVTLDGGTFNVLEDETFAGEGLLEPIKPTERRLISYAVDQGVHIVAEGNGDNDEDNEDDDSGATTVMHVRIAKGLMVLTREHRKVRMYTIRNADVTPRVVVIEHPHGEGWNLAKGTTAEETTDAAYRFRMNVGPGKSEKLTVNEVRPETAEIRVASISSDQVALWLKQKVLDPETEKAFRRLLAQQDEVNKYDDKLRQLQEESAAIVNDQARLRENMKALKGTAEERVLLVRYTKQLNDQEDRLAALSKEVADTKAKRAEANAALQSLAEAIALDKDL